MLHICHCRISVGNGPNGGRVVTEIVAITNRTVTSKRLHLYIKTKLEIFVANLNKSNMAVRQLEKR